MKIKCSLVLTMTEYKEYKERFYAAKRRHRYFKNNNSFQL